MRNTTKTIHSNSPVGSYLEENKAAPWVTGLWHVKSNTADADGPQSFTWVYDIIRRTNHNGHRRIVSRLALAYSAQHAVYVHSRTLDDRTLTFEFTPPPPSGPANLVTHASVAAAAPWKLQAAAYETPTVTPYADVISAIRDIRRYSVRRAQDMLTGSYASQQPLVFTRKTGGTLTVIPPPNCEIEPPAGPHVNGQASNSTGPGTMPVKFPAPVEPLAPAKVSWPHWRALNRTTGIIFPLTENGVRALLTNAHKANHAAPDAIEREVDDEMATAVRKREVILSSVVLYHSTVVVPPNVEVVWVCFKCKHCEKEYTNDYRIHNSPGRIPARSNQYCSPLHEAQYAAGGDGRELIPYDQIVKAVETARAVLTAQSAALDLIHLFTATADKKLVTNDLYLALLPEDITNLNELFPAPPFAATNRPSHAAQGNTNGSAS